MKKTIHLKSLVGEFAENKDTAKKLRLEVIMPTLAKRGSVVINFDGVTGATQSFIHALLSDPIREYQELAFENLIFKTANDDIRQIITIVYRYMQESLIGEGE